MRRLTPEPAAVPNAPAAPVPFPLSKGVPVTMAELWRLVEIAASRVPKRGDR